MDKTITPESITAYETNLRQLERGEAKLVWAYEKAFAENIGIQGGTYANTLMVELGERLRFVAGLTTKDALLVALVFIQRGLIGLQA